MSAAVADASKLSWDTGSDYYDRAIDVPVGDNRSVKALRIVGADHGPRPALLFVHGSCAWMGQWFPVISEFSKTYDCYAYDWFGCGRSPKPDVRSQNYSDKHPYSNASLQSDLRAVWEWTQADATSPRPTFVIGHSYGTPYPNPNPNPNPYPNPYPNPNPNPDR